MSEPPSSRERWLAELRRELRPLGRRRRRRRARRGQRPPDLGDRGRGRGRRVARGRRAARVGPVRRARRDRREPVRRPAAPSSRLAPAAVAAGAITAVLALAAGPIADGIAPRAAVAAASSGPSPRRCARGLRPGCERDRAGPRAGLRVLRVQIITDVGPLVRDQVPAVEPACAHRAVAVEGRHGERLGRHDPPARTRRGPNAIWRAGRLTANGLDADVPLQLGPPPTVESCLDAWNAAPPPVARPSHAAEPALVQAFTGGVYIATGAVRAARERRVRLRRLACRAARAREARQRARGTPERSADWGKPIKVGGLVGWWDAERGSRRRPAHGSRAADRPGRCRRTRRRIRR